MQLDVPLTGTAVQADAQDATAGRVLLNGAHGLGGTGAVLGNGDDYDDISKTQFMGTYSTGAAPANAPVAASLFAGLHVRSSSTQAMQLLARLSGGKGMYFRTKNNSWSDWQELYHSGSILGSVSEVGGIPSGAVIERGSNANGDYVRFADGTQICQREVAVDVTSVLTQQFPWPVGFAGADPAVSVNHLATAPNAALYLNNIRALNPSGSDCQIRLISAGSSSDPAANEEKLSVLALGRWV